MKEDKVKSAFANKSWNEIKTTDSWQVFKMMSEIVEGFKASLIILIPSSYSGVPIVHG